MDPTTTSPYEASSPPIVLSDFLFPFPNLVVVCKVTELKSHSCPLVIGPFCLKLNHPCSCQTFFACHREQLGCLGPSPQTIVRTIFSHHGYEAAAAQDPATSDTAAGLTHVDVLHAVLADLLNFHEAGRPCHALLLSRRQWRPPPGRLRSPRRRA
jgi:hypothetical protein